MAHVIETLPHRHCQIYWMLMTCWREEPGLQQPLYKNQFLPEYSGISTTRNNTFRSRQDGYHFPDDIFKWIFLNENLWILIKTSFKFVARGQITNIPALFQIMVWRRPGGKPSSEPVMANLLVNICVIQPQWVDMRHLLLWINVAWYPLKLWTFEEMFGSLSFSCNCKQIFHKHTLMYQNGIRIGPLLPPLVEAHFGMFVRCLGFFFLIGMFDHSNFVVIFETILCGETIVQV